MLLDEVKKHYGTWTNMGHDLKNGMNVYQYWRKIGYIPFLAQLLIQYKTNGALIADEAHARPKK